MAQQVPPPVITTALHHRRSIVTFTTLAHRRCGFTPALWHAPRNSDRVEEELGTTIAPRGLTMVIEVTEGGIMVIMGVGGTSIIVMVEGTTMVGVTGGQDMPPDHVGTMVVTVMDMDTLLDGHQMATVVTPGANIAAMTTDRSTAAMGIEAPLLMDTRTGADITVVMWTENTEWTVTMVTVGTIATEAAKKAD